MKLKNKIIKKDKKIPESTRVNMLNMDHDTRITQ
jgi:hypothetical protein